MDVTLDSFTKPVHIDEFTMLKEFVCTYLFYITALDAAKHEGVASEKEHTKTCQSVEDELLKPENIIPGLEYLGSGYNVLKALPFENNEMYLDPGYMQPVIQFKWKCNVDKNVAKNTPIGVWFRQEAACHKTHKYRKLESDSSLEEIISEDITTSFGIGEPWIKATNGFNSLKQWVNKQNTELAVYKTYCAIYSTGMILSYKWELSAGFRAMINSLIKNDGCDLTKDDNMSSICKETLEKWFNLFDEYGTHALTRITFGKTINEIRGKIIDIKQLDYKNTKNKARNKSSRQVEINFHVGSANYSSSDENKGTNELSQDNKYSKVYIIGGESFGANLDDRSFRKWINTVNSNPMPIRMETTPLSLFIPYELQLSYWKAFNLYKTRKSV